MSQCSAKGPTPVYSSVRFYRNESKINGNRPTLVCSCQLKQPGPFVADVSFSWATRCLLHLSMYLFDVVSFGCFIFLNLILFDFFFFIVVVVFRGDFRRRFCYQYLSMTVSQITQFNQIGNAFPF